MKLTLPPISFPNNPIGNSDDATKDPQHSTGVDSRTTEEATVNRKFVEHKPEERERVEMWAALVTVCFCCAFGLMGVMLRRYEKFLKIPQNNFTKYCTDYVLNTPERVGIVWDFKILRGFYPRCLLVLLY